MTIAVDSFGGGDDEYDDPTGTSEPGKTSDAFE